MNLQELPRLTDSINYIYAEHCKLEQDAFSLKLVRKEEGICIPVASITVLFLGTGTSITHQAVKTAAENGCMLIWCGEGVTKFYATGLGETRSSDNMVRQAMLCLDEIRHLEVVRKMYALRFKDLHLSTDMTLEQMRGVEGARMKSAYQALSKMTGVKWRGRNYKAGDFSKSDAINKAITSGNSLLYGLCNAIITTLGYSTALGFIHTGNLLSFTYDLSDLYKMEVSIPAAFTVIKRLGDSAPTESITREVRKECRLYIDRLNLISKMVKDLEYLFDVDITKSGLIQNEASLLWRANNMNKKPNKD